MSSREESPFDRRIRAFVRSLVGLADNEDRGALAALRRGLGVPPGHCAAMYPHVVPHLSEGGDATDRWFFVVGALFASHPRHQPGATLGETFGRARRTNELSDSGEAQFFALLDAHPDDLPERLRWAIGWLASKEIPVDWERLLRDLCRWRREDHSVQMDWARNYYRAA